jgi:hypothetical protein
MAMKQIVCILAGILWLQVASAQNAPYQGGIADGHATNSIQTFNPQGVILKFAPYRGGNGSGYTSDSISKFNGQAYIGKFAPFAGGNNDGWANHPYLLINTVSNYTACGDTTLTINFQSTGPINIGNQYTVQLSDINGVYGSPIVIGTSSTNSTSGSINCMLPANLAAGNYFIRLVSTNPVITGFSKAIAITIPPNLGVDTTLFIVCAGETLNISGVYNTTGLTATWNTPNTMAAPAGTHRLVATNLAGCRDTAFVTIQQDVLTWTGTVSNDWHTAGNWNLSRIPNEKSHVIINGSTPNPCTVNNPQARAASLQVRSGATVTVPINNQITITGYCNSLPN